MVVTYVIGATSAGTNMVATGMSLIQGLTFGALKMIHLVRLI
jgi:hypothetical protein